MGTCHFEESERTHTKDRIELNGSVTCRFDGCGGGEVVVGWAEKSNCSLELVLGRAVSGTGLGPSSAPARTISELSHEEERSEDTGAGHI